VRSFTAAGNGPCGISVFKTTGSSANIDTIRDCIISDHSLNGIKCEVGCTVGSMTFCDIFNCVTPYTPGSILTISDYLTNDPLFVYPTNGDFILALAANVSVLLQTAETEDIDTNSAF
jgi:hypothetical protein